RAHPRDGGRSYLVPRQRHRTFTAAVAADGGSRRNRGLLAALAPPANVRRRFAAHTLDVKSQRDLDYPEKARANAGQLLRNALQRFRDILLVRIEFERRFETRFCLGFLSLL